MSERTPKMRRDAITRARFFLAQARGCRFSDSTEWREPFEAHMEAAIIFGRIAIQRLKKSADRRSRNDRRLRTEVRAWWDSIADDPAIRFFRGHRDFIIHEGPPIVHQIIGLGGPISQEAAAYYYYESPDIPATETIERHLSAVEKIVTDAERRFGTTSLSGTWWQDLDG
jgi:hypothetical protein